MLILALNAWNEKLENIYYDFTALNYLNLSLQFVDLFVFKNTAFFSHQFLYF